MKKIGIYLDSSPSCGGTYQYNRFVVDALSEMTHSDYKIIAFYGEPHWNKYLAEKNIEAKYVPSSTVSRLLTGLWRRSCLPLTWWRSIADKIHPLAKAMNNERCDLWIFPSQDAHAYWMPVNALSTIHDLMHRYESRFPEVGEKSEYAKREFHYGHTCRFSKGILVDSKLGKQHAIDSYKIADEKCHVLPYIAPRDLCLVSSPNFDRKYQLPEKYLFYPAQFWAHKNHINLIKALAKCRAECPDIQLVLVGSKKNGFNEAMALIEELNLKDSVHALGLVDKEDIPELYRRARALVMPTFFGPTNIPPLEAWALQCPVGISGIYGMKEQLGDGALYFDPESIDDMANKMKMLWANDELCQTLVQNGIQKHQELNFDKFCSTLHQIIENVLSKEKTC